MIKSVIKFFTTKLLFGKLFEVIKNNLLLTTIPILLIISFFYIPYEYFNYLEFKERFPTDVFGVYFLLTRPFFVMAILIFVIFSLHVKIKKLEQERIEKLKKEEIERLEKIRLAKEKLEKLKSTTIVQVAEKATNKPIIGAGVGASTGAILGGSLGIVGKLAFLPIAINGGWFLAPIGAALGYLGVKAFQKKNKDKEKKDNE